MAAGADLPAAAAPPAERVPVPVAGEASPDQFPTYAVIAGEILEYNETAS